MVSIQSLLILKNTGHNESINMKNQQKNQLLVNVLGTIKQYGLFEEGDVVIVGLSGGPDSVCLVHILSQISDELNLKIIAVHINHMLRGAESDMDEEYARGFCNNLGIEFYSDGIDIKKLAFQKGLSLEEAGRLARYKQFELYANKHGASKIAVAHNKNDQAETVLMNIIRGTGLDGLKGIEIRRGSIVRPLLGTSRADIEHYCSINDLKPRIDSSNLKNSFTRNKIRLELIPFIDNHFNTDITQSLVRTADILNKEVSFLDEFTDKVFNKCLISICDSKIILDRKVLLEYHEAIKKRVLRFSIKKLKGSLKGIEKKHTEDMIKILDKGRTGAVICLPGDMFFERSYETIKIFVSNNTNFDNEISKEKTLNIPGISYFENVINIEASIIKVTDSKPESKFKFNEAHLNPNIQFFDYDSFNSGIQIRHRKNGDVFKPFKGRGTKKLKEYLIDEKIPRENREKMIFIACGNEIVWIIGNKTSDKFKVNENTKNILKLAFQSKNYD